MKTLALPKIKHNLLFDINTVTRDQLVELIQKWGYDNGGSYIIGLLMQINELKGFEPITVIDQNPRRSYGWEVRLQDRRDAIIEVPAHFEVKYLGYHDSHRGMKHYVLLYAGIPPSHEEVQKKMKSHGAFPKLA